MEKLLMKPRLQAAYFDHPPNLKLNNELFIRLTAISGSAVNTWLIYKILSRKNERAGWYSALLYSGCVYTSLISGFFILPDSPQVVFWLMSIYLLIKILIFNEVQTKNLLLFGVYAGIATMCKIHGMYLWFAAGLFILIFNRAQLKNKYVYVAALITLIIISPVFIWNYKNAL